MSYKQDLHIKYNLNLTYLKYTIEGSYKKKLTKLNIKRSFYIYIYIYIRYFVFALRLCLVAVKRFSENTYFSEMLISGKGKYFHVFGCISKKFSENIF